jgi:hypothetical protein
MKCVRSVGCVSELGVGTFGAGGDFWTEHPEEDYLWISALRRALELGIGWWTPLSSTAAGGRRCLWGSPALGSTTCL